MSEIDANNASISYEYDEFGRLIRTNRPDGSWIKRSFDDQVSNFGRRIAIRTSDGQDSIDYLDGDGRVWREEKSAPEGRRIARLYQYDALGQITRRSEPFFVGVQPGMWTTVENDALGAPARTIDVDGSIVADCAFDRVEIHIGKNGSRERRIHDAYGRLTTVEQVDDPLDLHQRNICAAPFPKPTRITHIQYDRLGRVTSVVDAAGRATVNRYDGLGRVVEVYDPDLGTSEATYDAQGNLLHKVNSAGETIEFTYDEANRLIQKDFGTRKAPGHGDLLFRYDEGHNNQNGRLTSVVSDFMQTRYEYDLLGNKVATHYKVKNRTFDIEYKYSEGKLARVVYPDGTAVAYSYDLSALISIQQVGSTTAIARYSAFNQNGDPQSAKLGANVALEYEFGTPSAPNCVRQNNLVCMIRRVDSNALTPSGAWEVKYAYDGAGFISKESVVNGGPSHRSFSYDFLGQLEEESSETGQARFAYDDLGDLIYKGDRQSPAFRYASAPVLASAINISGLPNSIGSDIYGHDRTWSFDALGRLQKVDSQKVERSYPDIFHFGPEGRLIGFEKTNFGLPDQSENARIASLYLLALNFL